MYAAFRAVLVPIIASGYADPEFGTGCVKITQRTTRMTLWSGERHSLALVKHD